MEVLMPNFAGMDVHQKTIVVCALSVISSDRVASFEGDAIACRTHQGPWIISRSLLIYLACRQFKICSHDHFVFGVLIKGLR